MGDAVDIDDNALSSLPDLQYDTLVDSISMRSLSPFDILSLRVLARQGKPITIEYQRTCQSLVDVLDRLSTATNLQNGRTEVALIGSGFCGVSTLNSTWTELRHIRWHSLHFTINLVFPRSETEDEFV